MKKAISIVLVLAGMIMIAVGAIPKVTTLVADISSAAAAVSVIGGADGPTAIFIGGKIGGPDLGWISIIAGVAVLIIGIIMFQKERKGA